EPLERGAEPLHGFLESIVAELTLREIAQRPGAMLTIAGLEGAVVQTMCYVLCVGESSPVVGQPETNRLRIGPVDRVVQRLAELLAIDCAALRARPVAGADRVQRGDEMRVSQRRLIPGGSRYCGGAAQDPFADSTVTSDRKHAAELGRSAREHCRRRRGFRALDGADAVADHSDHIVV